MTKERLKDFTGDTLLNARDGVLAGLTILDRAARTTSNFTSLILEASFKGWYDSFIDLQPLARKLRDRNLL